MDRRVFLEGAAALGLAGCLPVSRTVPGEVPPGRLARVRVAADRVIRSVVGLRPFRAPGFRLEAQRLGSKVVVHDYGHGGAGVTLSWGTARLAIEEGLSQSPGPAGVLGAGAVGLATARLLQRRGVPVTLYAKELPPGTTSNKAGALWSPYLVADPERRTAEFDARLQRAARLAHRAFRELVGDRYGVRWVDNYYLSDERPDPSPGPFHDLFPDRTVLGPGAHPFPSRYASRYRTLLIEPPVYLSALLDDLVRDNGQIVVSNLTSPDQVASLPEPLLFNCTGLGARALFGDDELIPVKGQLTVLLPQPEVDYVAMCGDLYMFPRRDGILLGGTHERGEWSLEPDPEAAAALVAGHRRIFEGMR